MAETDVAPVGEVDGKAVTLPEGYALVQAYEAMPEPAETLIAAGAHLLSEWLDDAAPLHERRYLSPAKAMLKFAAYAAALAASPSPAPTPASPPDEGEYDELVKQVRDAHADIVDADNGECELMQLFRRAADAISALQAKVGEWKERQRQQLNLNATMGQRLSEAVAVQRAAESALATERERADALRDFAAHTNWELSFLSEEEGDEYWAVHEVVGNVNDREWNLIGRGDTPHGAVAAALRTLAPKEPGNGN